MFGSNPLKSRILVRRLAVCARPPCGKSPVKDQRAREDPADSYANVELKIRNIHELPRRDSKPKKRLEDSWAMLCVLAMCRHRLPPCFTGVKHNIAYDIASFSRSRVLGLESRLGNLWIMSLRLDKQSSGSFFVHSAI